MSARAQRILAASLVALVFALLAFISGADRYSQYQPAATRFVPDVLKSKASLAEAAGALMAGDAARAATQATQAIRSDPLDSTGLSIRGAAHAMLGHEAQVARSFAAAEALGHRDPLVASYWFAAKLRRGDAQGAAEQLDALLRSQPDFAPAQDYLTMLEASSPGREALAKRLATSSRWSDTYLSATRMTTPTLRSRAGFLARQGGEVAQIGCDRVAPMVRELATRGFRGEAEALQKGQCGGAGDADTIADAEFEGFATDTAGPFGWTRHATGDVRISRLGGDRARVELENRSSVTRLVLSQPVALPAGAYSVQIKVDGPGGQRLGASLDCGTPARPRLRRERIDRDGWRLDATGCEDAILGLWLRPGSGRVVVDRVDVVAR